jgi:hypothetical protein
LNRLFVWRPISPGNEDVLICINASFMTQRILKLWWSWTYQNSAVKRTSARAILGWVTSWEVWFGEPKADNIVSLGVSRYKWYQSHCPAWDDGSVHKPNEGHQRASARAIPGWVTSWEIWFGEPKADNIVSLRVGRYSLLRT